MQVDNTSINEIPLPNSLLELTTNLQAVFLPLNFYHCYADLGVPLLYLTRAGIILPRDPKQFIVLNTSSWWSVPAFRYIEEIAILHQSAPKGFLEAFKTRHGDEVRLRFHRVEI